MKYYSIDETTARVAHNMMSMSDYKQGQKTEEYKQMVDDAAAIAEREKRRKPDYADVIDTLLDRYAFKLAEWMNTESRIGTMCPSILIAGGSNFPVRKKQKQNSRADAHMAKYKEVEGILDKIHKVGTGGIKANDEQALVKLEAKVEDLVELQERMKGVNAYYRKNKTLDGCDLLSQNQIEKFNADMAANWRIDPVPFPSYCLTNNNAEIRRLKKRIEELQEIKASGDSEAEVEDVEGLRVVEDTQLMRIQLIFDGKPEPEIRSILKGNGFRWAPSQGAWQRQLNSNGQWAARRAIEEIRKIQTHEVGA